jgi:hypothetical protein
MPLSAGLGTVILGRPCKALEIFGGTMDRAKIDPHVWGWPVSDPQPFPAPVPARGAQGLWEWAFGQENGERCQVLAEAPGI